VNPASRLAPQAIRGHVDPGSRLSF
jgi:hypothetical protein